MQTNEHYTDMSERESFKPRCSAPSEHLPSTVGTASVGGAVVPVGIATGYLQGFRQLMDFGSPAITVSHLTSDDVTRLSFSRVASSIRVAFGGIRARTG
jgi:hypothetical protein